VKPVLQLMQKIPVKGLAHITGGGIVDNLPRVLSDGLTAHIDGASWPRPPLFAWLQEQGNVAEAEMLRVFNCGIGMIIVVAPEHAEATADMLRAAGETVWRIGSIAARAAGEEQTVVA
jgi:phosphoribosylformylglycinamidine cyclo-ligase